MSVQQIMPKASIAATPDLRVVPVRQIIPHEFEDASRAEPLIRRLPQDGVLRNPPIVTELNDAAERYVILDGTNRVMALDALNYQHALVQVVKYEEPFVELHTWNHVLVGMHPDEICDQLVALPNLDVCAVDAFHAKAALARRAILAYALLANGQVLSLAGGGSSVIERTRLLQNIVDLYVNRGQLYRTNLDQLDDIKQTYPQMAAAIIFPHYQAVEVLELATRGLPVPMGITRHVIQGRALRINYPLDLLAATCSLEEKNAALNHWMQDRFAGKSVRYYAESTYVFDE
jgi:L-serine kinase (ATP) / ParB family transcriptional regulator, heme-responsive regulator